MILRIILRFSVSLLCTISFAYAQSGEVNDLQLSVEQLRSSIGRWDVITQFLNEDGSPAKTVSGTYEFSWVITDRLVSGKSEIPELKQVSALLFYVNEAKQLIEMVSVGADGNLWVMTGALGQEVRTTKAFETASGGTSQLKFTRYNVTADSFESKMEYSSDGGESWQPGNHQMFRRVFTDSQ